jgi:hypothetical protein
MTDVDVCKQDPYICKQLLYLERLILNNFNAKTKITN